MPDKKRPNLPGSRGVPTPIDKSKITIKPRVPDVVDGTQIPASDWPVVREVERKVVDPRQPIKPDTVDGTQIPASVWPVVREVERKVSERELELERPEIEKKDG
ncbi:MAG: hypothetical protein ACPG4T_08175 [Nannocystaceae bacterium]